jgi:hypothetical protein
MSFQSFSIQKKWLENYSTIAYICTISGEYINIPNAKDSMSWKCFSNTASRGAAGHSE